MSALIHAVHGTLLAAGAATIGFLLFGGARQTKAVARLRAARDAGAQRGVDGIVVAATRRAQEQLRGTGQRSGALAVLVLANTAAAVVHGAVCPSHFHEGTALGLFFLLLMTVQFSLAAAAASGHWARVLCPTILVSVGTASLWVITRTSDLPLGLAAREPVGVVAVLATGAELAAAAAAVVLYRRSRSVPAPVPFGLATRTIR